MKLDNCVFDGQAFDHRIGRPGPKIGAGAFAVAWDEACLERAFCPFCSAMSNSCLRFISSFSNASVLLSASYIVIKKGSSIDSDFGTYRLLICNGNKLRLVVALCLKQVVDMSHAPNELRADDDGM